MPPPLTPPPRKKSKLSLQKKNKTSESFLFQQDPFPGDEDEPESPSILASLQGGENEKNSEQREEREQNPEPRGEKEKGSVVIPEENSQDANYLLQVNQCYYTILITHLYSITRPNSKNIFFKFYIYF